MKKEEKGRREEKGEGENEETKRVGQGRGNDEEGR